MNKDILLVPESITRRLSNMQVSLDILMSPDLVVKYLSTAELVAIEVLNTNIDQLLHPSTANLSKNIFVSSQMNCKFTSYFHRIYCTSMNPETKKIFDNTLFPIVKNQLDLSILDEMKGPTRELRNMSVPKPFIKYDTETSFAVISIASGAFATSSENESPASNAVRNLPTSMSLTEVFLELVLSVLHMYSTRPEVAVTDVYGKYVRLLAAEVFS